MAQPTQLTPTEQDALVKQIGLAMLRVAPDDWEQLTVDYRSVGRYSEATSQVVYSDGGAEPWTMPPDLQGLFARLRGGMYREGRGTWFNARYRLDHPSSYNLEYDREEPAWEQPPPPQAYPDDMRLFPRTDDNVPAWLRRWLASAPPPRFRVARIFDGPPGEDGRPSVSRPPVDHDDVPDVLKYLDSAPVVGPARGYDVDRFDPDARPAVPVAFHTDGTWIWPAAVNYYLREHDVPPEPELVEHIARAQFQVPMVDDSTRSAAAAFLGAGPGPGGPGAGPGGAGGPGGGGPGGPGGPPRMQPPPGPAPTRTMQVPPPAPAAPGSPPPAALPSHGPPGRTVDALRSRLDELGIPQTAYRIGPAAGRAWTMDQTEDGWRVGWFDREFVAPAMFEDVADASAFLLGKLLLDAERWQSGHGPGGHGGHGLGSPDPAGLGPAGLGPAGLGPAGHGPGSHDSAGLGLGGHGPAGHGLAGHGPGDHGPGSHDPAGLGLGGHGPGDHGPGGHDPAGHGPGDPPPGMPVPPAPVPPPAENPADFALASDPADGFAPPTVVAPPADLPRRPGRTARPDSPQGSFNHFDSGDSASQETRFSPPLDAQRSDERFSPPEPDRPESMATFDLSPPESLHDSTYDPSRPEHPGSAYDTPRSERQDPAHSERSDPMFDTTRSDRPTPAHSERSDAMFDAARSERPAHSERSDAMFDTTRSERPAHSERPDAMFDTTRSERPAHSERSDSVFDSVRADVPFESRSERQDSMFEPARSETSFDRPDGGFEPPRQDPPFEPARSAPASERSSRQESFDATRVEPSLDATRMDAPFLPSREPMRSETSFEPPRSDTFRTDSPPRGERLPEAPKHEPATTVAAPVRPAASSSGSASANQDWPISPLPGEPPLTLFRGKRLVELEPGTELDRYGEDDGNLVYAAGTPFSERSLVPDWVERPYHAYRVRQPVQVLTGAAIPWFDQPGGGTAYLLPDAVGELLAEGSIVEIGGRERPPA